jgi:hypothetical protein
MTAIETPHYIGFNTEMELQSFELEGQECICLDMKCGKLQSLMNTMMMMMIIIIIIIIISLQ